MEHFQDSKNKHQKPEIHHQDLLQSQRSTITSIASRTNSLIIIKRIINHIIEQINQQKDDIVRTIITDLLQFVWGLNSNYIQDLKLYMNKDKIKLWIAI